MDDPCRRPGPNLYHPLPPRCIRVFELEAGDFSDPIVGRLVLQTVEAEPYEAVSYVWGDATKRHNITIDGATVSVTENLHGALTAYRHRPVAVGNNGDQHGDSALSPRQPVRRLWADAVCINQDDLQERISQVELMALIYANAQRVLSWLGWEEGVEGRRHIQDAIRFIREFMKDPETSLAEARVLLLHHDYLADPEEDLSHLSARDRSRFEEQARKWEAVKFFFEIEYFHRAWVVQELGLAREAIMITALKPTDSGQAKIEEADRRDSGNELVAPEIKTSNSWALESDVIDWPLLGRFVEYMDYNGASLVTHLGLVLWVAHHVLMVWATKPDGTPDCDFLTGMHWTRILRVTDARDRVFSLLGHPKAVLDGELVISPDYTRTRGVIYTRLAVNFIRKTKNLYIVSLVDHEEDPSLEQSVWDPQHEARMPTWVPDWHSINRTTPVDYAIAAAVTEDDGIEIEGGVDCENGTPLPHLLLSGWVMDEVSVLSRRMETTDFPITHLARERTKQNPFWLDHIWEMAYPAEKRETSTGNDALALLDSLSLALPLGVREKDEPPSKAGLNQPLDEHNRSFAAYVIEYHNLLQAALAEAQGTNRKDANFSYLPRCSILDSLPDEAQQEIRRRAEGASAGGFLECMMWPSMCRIVYRTASGLVGMGSRVTKPGDLICRVKGSAVLMTLRRTNQPQAVGVEADGEEIRCVHIGPTVVPARMKRDVIDGAEFGERPARFRIM